LLFLGKQLFNYNVILNGLFISNRKIDKSNPAFNDKLDLPLTFMTKAIKINSTDDLFLFSHSFPISSCTSFFWLFLLYLTKDQIQN